MSMTMTRAAAAYVGYDLSAVDSAVKDKSHIVYTRASCCRTVDICVTEISESISRPTHADVNEVGMATSVVGLADVG